MIAGDNKENKGEFLLQGIKAYRFIVSRIIEKVGGFFNP